MTRLALTLSCFLLSGTIATAAPTEAPRARMLAVPKPIYPQAAVQNRVQGAGQFRIEMDYDSGKALRVVVVKSTGSPLLDNAAVAGLRRWRAAPRTVRVINLPLFFRLTSHGPDIQIK